MTHKEKAYKLFLIGEPQREIAQMLNVSENSVSDWAKKGNWKAKRSAINMFEENAAENIRLIVSHDLAILKRIAEKKQTEISDDSTVEELEKALTSKGAADSVSKFFGSIKQKELSWDNIIKIQKELLKYIEGVDFSLAKKVAPILTDFVNLKR